MILKNTRLVNNVKKRQDSKARRKMCSRELFVQRLSAYRGMKICKRDRIEGDWGSGSRERVNELCGYRQQR